MVKSHLPASFMIQQNDGLEVPTSSLSKENTLLEYKTESHTPDHSIFPPPSHRRGFDVAEEDILREVEAIWEIDSKKVDDTASCTTTVTEIRESASFSPTPLKRKKKRKKKVRFLSPLVTKVGETHCVLPADRHKFFYSRENIMWFRQEFESEKYPLCGLCESFERSTMHLCSGFSFRFKRRTPETLAPEDVGPP